MGLSVALVVGRRDAGRVVMFTCVGLYVQKQTFLKIQTGKDW